MSGELEAIAERLVALCREDKAETALDELYAEDAVSIEPMPIPKTESRETVGLAGIRGKHEW